MNKTPEPFVISITSHGNKYTAEINWDANISEIVEATRGLLIACGFLSEQIHEHFKTDSDLDEIDEQFNKKLNESNVTSSSSSKTPPPPPPDRRWKEGETPKPPKYYTDPVFRE